MRRYLAFAGAFLGALTLALNAPYGIVPALCLLVVGIMVVADG